MKNKLTYTISAAMAAIAAVTSCKIDNTPTYFSYMTAVKEQPSNQDVSYLVTDDSTLVYPTEWPSGLSGMKHNQRLFATFSVPSGELGDRIEASFQSYGYVSEDSITVTSSPDTLGSDPVNLIEAWHSGGIYGAGRFVTLSFTISGVGYYRHSIALVDNTGSANPDAEGYWNLELRHNANNDPQAYLSQSVFSFPLSEKYTASGIKGLKISFTPLNSNTEKTFTIDYSE